MRDLNLLTESELESELIIIDLILGTTNHTWVKTVQHLAEERRQVEAMLFERCVLNNKDD